MYRPGNMLDFLSADMQAAKFMWTSTAFTTCYLADRPVRLQKVWLQESVKQIACQALNGIVDWQYVDTFAILDIRALQE